MTAWREQKRQARRVVHNTMALDVLHYTEAGAMPTPVRARLHTKFGQIGDDRSMGWAEMEAVKPRLIFMISDLAAMSVQIERNNIIYVDIGEAYNIDNTLPPDDITITAEVTRLSRKQYQDAGLPVAGATP
jgi:hypothetical protein